MLRWTMENVQIRNFLACVNIHMRLVNRSIGFKVLGEYINKPVIEYLCWHTQKTNKIHNKLSLAWNVHLI